MSEDGPLLLTDVKWKVYYSPEGGDLVGRFFEPALARCVLYRRMTGYFSADVFAVVAKGLNGLIHNNGRMQLIVGCTLEEDEIQQVQKGEELQHVVEQAMARQLEAQPLDEEARERLGWLSWLIAKKLLEIKVAVPRNKNGEYQKGLGLYHPKVGLLQDIQGNKVLFTGSNNETAAGWSFNWEAFMLRRSWRGEDDVEAIQEVEAEFTRLWEDKAWSAKVMTISEALTKKLLGFLPDSDKVVVPPPCLYPVEPVPTPPVPAIKEIEAPLPPPEPNMDPAERRRLVWEYLATAPQRKDGALVAVKTSAITPWPHQLRAYRRMLDSWPFRLLIADEVGLGKTIEAGMLLRHAWISGLAKRVLILVPAGVLGQWQAELYEKFNLVVPIYTGKSLLWPDYHGRRQELEEPIDRATWTQQPLVLASSHLMRRNDRRKELTDAQDWDLLVVDEAHHARRQAAGTAAEKGANRMLSLLREIRQKAGALLLMTATPMQVHPIELYDLLACLGLPPAWTDKVFLDYFERIHQNPDDDGLWWLAKMFQATEQHYGPLRETDALRVGEGMGLSKLGLQKVLKALREPKTNIPLKRLSTQERKAALALLRVGSPVRYGMSRHTRNLLREYHKKGLLEQPIAERVVWDRLVELSPPERSLYDRVEDYIGTTYQAAAPDKKTAVGFVMTVYRRRLASSFFALRRTLERRLSELKGAPGTAVDDVGMQEDTAEDDLADVVAAPEEVAALEHEALVAEEESSILALLKDIALLGTDSKALRLVGELKAAFAKGYDSAIIFTQYGHTMEYLREFLPERLGVPVGSFSGKGGARQDKSGRWVPCSKEAIKRLLRTGEIKLLVCTDAAGEGLNLQTCGVIVNYDLPWNPMKVEQRIGRVDRIGQKYPEVIVINLAYKDTVEADVYFALSERIGLFNGVVGKLQPILAQLPRQIEQSIFAGRDQRERIRHEVVANVHDMVAQAEQAAFDIDEVSDADLVPPEFPPSPLLPKHIEAVLKNPDLLPLGVECAPLDPHTYTLQLPGQDRPARVTPMPDVFDEHFESHQLIGYGGPLFEEMMKRALAEGGGTTDVPTNLSIGKLLGK